MYVGIKSGRAVLPVSANLWLVFLCHPSCSFWSREAGGLQSCVPSGSWIPLWPYLWRQCRHACSRSLILLCSGFTTEAQLSQLKEVGVEEQLQSYHSGFHLGKLRAWKEQRFAYWKNSKSPEGWGSFPLNLSSSVVCGNIKFLGSFNCWFGLSF